MKENEMKKISIRISIWRNFMQAWNNGHILCQQRWDEENVLWNEQQILDDDEMQHNFLME